MTIPAPYQVLHSRLFKKCFFERELFFETYGACWTKEFRLAHKRYLLTIQRVFLRESKTKYHWREFLTLAKDELVEKWGVFKQFRIQF
jgi:hypothetical protein